MLADRQRDRELAGRQDSEVRNRLLVRTRGQSEIIGYVAVFSIVVLLVSIAITTGYSQLEDARSFEQANGASRTVERFAAEVDALLRDDSRQRSVEVDLGEGSVSGGEPVTVNVSGHAVDDPTRNFSRSITLRTLEFTVADTRIRYVGGAVVREQDDGAVMVRGPPGIFSGTQTVIPVVDTELQGGSIGGQSQVELKANRPKNGSNLVASTTESYELTVSIETPNPDLWERTLETELNTSCSQSGNTVSCSYTTERLSGVTHRIVVTHNVERRV